jgi:hypothetical protein
MSARSILGRNGASAQRSMDQRESLAGLVERVILHNPDSGFCVLRVEARGRRDLITVIGHAPTNSADEFVQASGAWVNDRTHASVWRNWQGVRAGPTAKLRDALVSVLVAGDDGS